jgi:type I restriction enzyme M protein
VSIDDIIARNFNLDIKNPHVGEVISHDPQELLNDYAKQKDDIQVLREKLKGILSAALASDGK